MQPEQVQVQSVKTSQSAQVCNNNVNVEIKTNYLCDVDKTLTIYITTEKNHK